MISARVVIVGLLAFTVPLVAAVPALAITAQQRAQGLTEEDLEANKKTLGRPTTELITSISRATESRFKYSGMLSYGVRQDVAQEREPVLTTHRLLGTTSATILDRPVVAGVDDELANEVVTLSLAASGQFKTLGQEVHGNVHGSAVVGSDIDLSASRGFDLEKLMGASNGLDLTIGSSVPTSDDTQYEGVVAVPYASFGWALGFAGGRYNITQSVSADYIVNRFSHSPVTHEVNADFSSGYSLSASARLGAGFRFTLGGGARLVRHMDETVTSAFNNFQILSWTRGFATVTLRHANGSRAEDHTSHFWFIDEYRRVVSLGLSVRF